MPPDKGVDPNNLAFFQDKPDEATDQSDQVLLSWTFTEPVQQGSFWTVFASCGDWKVQGIAETAEDAQARAEHEARFHTLAGFPRARPDPEFLMNSSLRNDPAQAARYKKIKKVK